jgi:hypothetical protein
MPVVLASCLKTLKRYSLYSSVFTRGLQSSVFTNKIYNIFTGIHNDIYRFKYNLVLGQAVCFMAGRVFAGPF